MKGDIGIMALQECGLNLNSDSKELLPQGTLEFPCAGYSSHYTDIPDDIIPWHWHDELEIIYIEAGRLQLKFPSVSFYIEQGNIAAINADVLHYGAAAPDCRLHSLVFSQTLITGNDASAFAKKYLDPLTSCSAFSGYLIESDEKNKVVNRFRTAFNALACDLPGFEFTVRENLSFICYSLYTQFKSEFDEQRKNVDLDSIRMKKMLAYIQRNFADNLSLSEIAGAANISERESLRCFKRTIQLPPIQYLLKYRVMRGAELLEKDPAVSISEAAASCGFDSPSNFAKMFKRYYNYTPREYKNRGAR